MKERKQEAPILMALLVTVELRGVNPDFLRTLDTPERIDAFARDRLKSSMIHDSPGTAEIHHVEVASVEDTPPRLQRGVLMHSVARKYAEENVRRRRMRELVESIFGALDVGDCGDPDCEIHGKRG